ncbi:MAG: tetratricopeptide repeat protein [Deltaproteobacteria bacterium]|nr:tetratricopeptide repeat protein [Deltaproteobacteria bacterium]
MGLLNRIALPVALAVAAPLSAAAQATDPATASTLFEQGVHLASSGRIDEACDKFAASMRADPSSGTLFNLAHCHELQGKTATAHGEYERAAQMDRQAARIEEANQATAYAAKLKPRLSRLTIRLSAEAPGLSVLRDGAPVDRAAFGVPVAVDPGAHRIETSGTGYRSWSASIRVEPDGDRKEITIPVGQDAAPQPKQTERPATSARATIGWALAGGGAGAMTVAAALFGLRVQDVDDYDRANADGNKAASDAAVDRANTKAAIGGVGLALGAVSAGAGLYLLLSPRTPDTTPTASVRPVPLGGGAGLAAIARF